MANTIVQIRRSNTAASPSPTANLNSGELAYSYNSNSLFIGAQTGTTGTSFKIGGWEYGYLDNAGSPGVQSANATVILDANSFTTNVYTQGLVIATSAASITTPAISSINAVANSTVLGAATNTELTTTWAIKTYVDTKTGGSSTVGGANTQVLFNDSTLANGVAGFTFNKVTNNATIANNLSVASVNVNTLASLNSTALWISTNSTVNTVITATTLVQSNTTAVPFTANDTGIWTTGRVNAFSHTVGTTFVANSTQVVLGVVGTNAVALTTTTINVGNATVNSTINSTAFTGSANNTTYLGGYTFTAPPVIGSTTANGISVTYANVSGQVNTATLYATTSANIASAVQANATGVYTTGTVNAASHTVGTSFVANSIQVTVGTIGTNATQVTTTTINVGNSSVNATVNSTTFSGTALTANNATNLGGTAAASYVQNTDSRTLSGNLTFTGANLSVTGTNTYVTSNVTIATTNTNITSNLVVTGVNFSTSSNTTFSGANVSITGTNTYITSNVVITSSNVDAASAVLRIRDIVATGNLTVQGTLTAIDTTSLQVKDNFIELADQNNLAATDAVDFGWYGVANISSTTTYFGMGRIAGASNTFTLFSTATKPAAAGALTGLTIANLRTYLSSGALTSNSSTVTITANSTINVNITANTLSLSTALSPGNGGTGLSSYTTGDLLYASGAGTLARIGIAANGNVLQIINNLPAYGGLDGGTF